MLLPQQLTQRLGATSHQSAQPLPLAPKVAASAGSVPVICNPCSALGARGKEKAQGGARKVSVSSAAAVTERTKRGAAKAGGGLKSSAGKAEPLGPSRQDKGVNFALFSKAAKSVKLCLFDANKKPLAEYNVDKKTGDVWHILVEGLPTSGVLYGYRVTGDGFRFKPERLLLDPYAPLVFGRKLFGVRDEVEEFEPTVGSTFYGTYDFDTEPFDWGKDYKKPNIHQKDMVVYELTPRCFTSHASSNVPEGERGTFKGLEAKVPYLAELGVNAVEILPVFEYDELEFQRRPNPRDHMVNVWGYSHMSFMAPMARFAANGGGAKAAAREFKELVRSLHNKGIEVLLDVVYNHTVEGDDVDPYTINLRAIDPYTYYMIDDSQPTAMLNITGCGNTVNANNPVTKKYIMDSLVHWVEEYHVDGFRFDLASCLCRGEKGQPLAVPPLIHDIAKHPVLSKCKLIAEPWDLGMYQVGSFPNWDIWSEWNGRYRDDVRRFIKGDPGMKPAFATRVSGSADLYKVNQRKPYHSINFINAHDGFSLADLVSYNSKHNNANGENNNDGSNDNLSWNCGAEGVTQNAGVLALRARQQRNFMLALMVSQGTPMIVMGDEACATHGGNNNWYGHDNDISQFKWGSANPDKDAEGMQRFTSELIKFRKEHPALGREEFIGAGDIVWHEDNWQNEESRFLAFTLKDPTQGFAGDLYLAFNAHSFQVDITLPPAPSGTKWCRVVDTNLAAPKDFTPGGNAGVAPKYGIQAFSSIMLVAKKV